MKKVIIASKNPLKIKAVEYGFGKMLPEEEFTFEGISVESEVPDQPMGSKETYQGASNRADNAKKEIPHADFWVGLESGAEDSFDGMIAYAWIVIRSKDQKGSARTADFLLPTEVAKLMRSGLEFNDADDKVFNRTNSRHSNGTIGILTDDIMTRQSMMEDGVVYALIPFKNLELFK